jgi:hypothetical protein
MECDRVHDLVFVSRQLSPKIEDLVSPHRRLVRQGTFHEVPLDSTRASSFFGAPSLYQLASMIDMSVSDIWSFLRTGLRSLHLFLFNDVLLITERNIIDDSINFFSGQRRFRVLTHSLSLALHFVFLSFFVLRSLTPNVCADSGPESAAAAQLSHPGAAAKEESQNGKVQGECQEGLFGRIAGCGPRQRFNCSSRLSFDRHRPLASPGGLLGRGRRNNVGRHRQRRREERPVGDWAAQLQPQPELHLGRDRAQPRAVVEAGVQDLLAQRQDPAAGTHAAGQAGVGGGSGPPGPQAKRVPPHLPLRPTRRIFFAVIVDFIVNFVVFRRPLHYHFSIPVVTNVFIIIIISITGSGSSVPDNDRFPPRASRPPVSCRRTNRRADLTILRSFVLLFLASHFVLFFFIIFS